jgi:hypothetical protein
MAGTDISPFPRQGMAPRQRESSVAQLVVRVETEIFREAYIFC